MLFFFCSCCNFDNTNIFLHHIKSLSSAFKGALMTIQSILRRGVNQMIQLLVQRPDQWQKLEVISAVKTLTSVIKSSIQSYGTIENLEIQSYTIKKVWKVMRCVFLFLSGFFVFPWNLTNTRFCLRVHLKKGH